MVVFGEMRLANSTEHRSRSIGTRQNRSGSLPRVRRLTPNNRKTCKSIRKRRRGWPASEINQTANFSKQAKPENDSTNLFNQVGAACLGSAARSRAIVLQAQETSVMAFSSPRPQKQRLARTSQGEASTMPPLPTAALRFAVADGLLRVPNTRRR